MTALQNSRSYALDAHTYTNESIITYTEIFNFPSRTLEAAQATICILFAGAVPRAAPAPFS